MSDLTNYYVSQAGSGFPSVYSGLRYQKGSGFLGNLLKGHVFPLLKRALPFLGEKLLNTGSSVISDVRSGKKFGESAKRRFKDTAFDIGIEGLTKMKQRGSGRRRKSGSKKGVVPKQFLPYLRMRRQQAAATKSSTTIKGKRKARKTRRTKSKVARRRKSPKFSSLLI